jgi:hypothetical protein
MDTTRKCQKCKTPYRLTTVGFLVLCTSCEIDHALIQYGLVNS